MTIEEGIAAAKAGDVGAMENVGDYFAKLDGIPKEEQMERSIPWYELAAEHGSIYGALMLSSYYSWFCFVNRAEGLDDDIYENSLKLEKYARMALSANNLPKNIYTSAEKYLEEALYCRCLFLFCSEKNDQPFFEIIHVLNQIPEDRLSARTRGLLAMCYYIIGQHEKAFQIARVFEDLAYTYSVKEYDFHSQLSIFWGYEVLSSLYRTGSTPSGVKDNEKAYGILFLAKQNLSNDGVIKSIKGELAKYQRTIFGGLKYIE